jgi:hypothetical protein
MTEYHQSRVHARAHGFADVANVTGGHMSMVAGGGFNWET